MQFFEKLVVAYFFWATLYSAAYARLQPSPRPPLRFQVWMRDIGLGVNVRAGIIFDFLFVCVIALC